MRRVFINTKPHEDDTAAVRNLIPRVANFVLILSETSLDNPLCLEEVKVGRPCIISHASCHLYYSPGPLAFAIMCPLRLPHLCKGPTYVSSIFYILFELCAWTSVSWTELFILLLVSMALMWPTEASASMRALSLMLPLTSHAGSSCLRYQYNSDSGHRCQVCCWAVFVFFLTLHIIQTEVGTRDLLMPYHEDHLLMCHQFTLARQ